MNDGIWIPSDSDSFEKVGKLVTCDLIDQHGKKWIREINPNLVKTASVQYLDVHPDVMGWFGKNSTLPEELYYVMEPMGALEYWGPNGNGDGWRETMLKQCHQTFLDGNVFVHHINKDPEKSVGRILVARYLPDMRRVELLIGIARNKVPGEFQQAITEGKPIGVSMGCRVPFDSCSICGNRSRSRAEYCDHARYHMGEIMPDGRQVYVDNPIGRFFDLSLVRKPADPVGVMFVRIGQDKVSGARQNRYTTISSYEDKMGPLAQKIDAQLQPIPDATLGKLARLGDGDIAGGFINLGMIPKPIEIFKIVQTRNVMGFSNGFDPSWPKTAEAVEILLPHFLKRSFLYPAPIYRLMSKETYPQPEISAGEAEIYSQWIAKSAAIPLFPLTLASLSILAALALKKYQQMRPENAPFELYRRMGQYQIVPDMRYWQRPETPELRQSLEELLNLVSMSEGRGEPEPIPTKTAEEREKLASLMTAGKILKEYFALPFTLGKVLPGKLKYILPAYTYGSGVLGFMRSAQKHANMEFKGPWLHKASSMMNRTVASGILMTKPYRVAATWLQKVASEPIQSGEQFSLAAKSLAHSYDTFMLDHGIVNGMMRE